VTGFATQNKGAFSAASYQGNIGTGFLKRFVVTFDYGHSVMYLKPVARPSDDIGTYDRAGFWINGTAHGFKVVEVTPHTPGDEAGIKVDDEIVAVDGKPASSIPLYEMRKRLRDEPPGTVVTFTMKRGDELKTIAVRLRDVI
jgi:S1-C subfamily serine protease